MNTQPFFSIVIPSLNEEKYLPHLLTDLAAQTFTGFEVIHVDGESEDKTVARVQSFSSKLKITQLSTSKRNVSFQRNLGGTHSKGEWIIFMDADNRLAPTFLEDIFKQLEIHPEIDVFTTWIVTDLKSKVYQMLVSMMNTGLDLYQAIGKPTSFGALIGCRRSVFKEVKFDEHQKVLEDTLFITEVVKKKFRFHIFHEPRYNYSLRRVKKEGLLKISLQVLSLQQAFLRGKDFKVSNHGYVMKGGTYYHQGGTPPKVKKTKSKKSLSRKKTTA